MPLRCTRHRVLARLAVLLTAVLAPALAAAGTRIVHVGLESPAGVAARIGIEGAASGNCVPRIDRIVADGADISIELTAAATGCSQRQRPFHLRADTAEAFGSQTLPSVYRVHVYSGAARRLVAFQLIDASPRGTALEPESGFWWTQAGPGELAAAGSGVSFEVQEGQLAASLLGFTDSGAPTWYFGSAPVIGRTARIPLVQLANGEDWFSAIGTPPEMAPGPRLEIEFLSPSRANAYLVRGDDAGDTQVRRLMLSRSSFSDGPVGSAWTGRWVLVPEDGGAPRLFDFGAASHRDAESFHLADTTSEAMLDCRLIAGTQQADACTLTQAATTIADFDQIGLDHFSGHGANGAPVQFLRVPR